MRNNQPSTACLVLIAAAFSLSGCSSENPTEQASGSLENSAVDSPTAEESFEEQLTRIRNTESDAIALTREIVSDEQVLLLKASDELRTLKLDAGQPSDIGIVHIAQLESLEHLRLRETPVSNKSLQSLTKCKRLRFLNLPHARFDDSVLADVAAMPVLEMFRFHSPEVTDTGIGDLLKSNSLRFLHLINVKVTDQSVDAFIQCKSLESLYIDGGGISDAGIRRIYESRRDLHIHLDQKHHDLDPAKHDH